MIKKIAQLFKDLLGIATQQNSFVENAFLASKTLNHCGLHSLRYCLAHVMTCLRWQQLRFFLTPAQRQAFLEQGYLKIENVLPPAEFATLCEELRTLEAPVRECLQGDTATQRILLEHQTLKNMPQTRQFIYAKKMQKLWQFCSSRLHLPIFYLQCIKNGTNSVSQADPQKKLHSDTFHPTLKCWYFLQDVEPHGGAFTYVPGSQRFSWARLRWENAKIAHLEMHRDGYSEKGSLRLDHAGHEAMQLQSPQVLSCRANTLVLANTHGFHQRGPAEPESSRIEIWGYSRGNPFLPWVGLNLNCLHRLEYRLLKLKLARAEQQAQQRRQRASWHTISLETFKTKNKLFER